MRELLEKTLKINEFDIKKALRTAAVTTAIGGAALGIGLQRGVTSKEVEKPTTTVAVEEPAKKVSIDLNKIAKIESSGDPKAENTVTGARGLHQIMKPTWNEVVLKMGVDWSWWDDAFDVEKNTKVADYYMNTRIPQMLGYYDLEDTIENRLISYNWGIGNLKRVIKNYGIDYLDHIPSETSNYIQKYLGK